jgi:hypothetical protein
MPGITFFTFDEANPLIFESFDDDLLENLFIFGDYSSFVFRSIGGTLKPFEGFSVDFIFLRVIGIDFFAYSSISLIFLIFANPTLIVADAVLSEHLFNGKVSILFCTALKVTTPATILPLAVLIEMMRST